MHIAHSIHYGNVEIYITSKRFMFIDKTTKIQALTGFTLEGVEMLRPAVSAPFLILPQMIVSRDMLLEQLQKGLLIPDDLGSCSLTDCSSQDFSYSLNFLST